MKADYQNMKPFAAEIKNMESQGKIKNRERTLTIINSTKRTLSNNQPKPQNFNILPSSHLGTQIKVENKSKVNVQLMHIMDQSKEENG